MNDFPKPCGESFCLCHLHWLETRGEARTPNSSRLDQFSSLFLPDLGLLPAYSDKVASIHALTQASGLQMQVLLVPGEPWG